MSIGASGKQKGGGDNGRNKLGTGVGIRSRVQGPIIDISPSEGGRTYFECGDHTLKNERKVHELKTKKRGGGESEGGGCYSQTRPERTMIGNEVSHKKRRGGYHRSWIAGCY